MRHGISPLVHNEETDPERNGCFFCNDYLAPSDTMKDRTLDQQCTVTRPGLSYVSSGFAVELLVNILSHPLGNAAPFEEEKDIYKFDDDSMGMIPQHIRGSVGYFESKIMQSTAFGNCLGCSKSILEEYQKDKKSMIVKALNDPEYLQVASGLNDILFNPDNEDGEGIIIIDDF